MIRITIEIDGEGLSNDAISDWINVPRRLRKIKELLQQSIHNEERVMAEIDELNAKLDAQATAITDFNTTLQTATTAIATEIQQLADAIQSATDLETLKAQVTAAAGRVSANNDAISAAGATLQAQVVVLGADDPPIV